MRVWQKVYVVTLAVFLAAFDLGLLLAAGFLFHYNIEMGKQQAQTASYFLCQNLEHDFSILEQNGRYEEEIVQAVVRGYQSFYEKEHVSLSLREEEEPYGITVESRVLKGGQTIFVEVEQTLAVPYDGWVLSYERELIELEEMWRTVTRTFVTIGVGISVFLCVLLYVLMRWILRPLGELNAGVEKIAKGDYDWQIPCRGRDEIAELSSHVNEMSQTIRAQMLALQEEKTRYLTVSQKKQQLMDNMAHELRTPLTSIYGYAEYLARANATTEETYEGLAYIMEESRRLARMGETMLSMRLYEREPGELGTVSVHRITEHVQKMLMAMCQKKGVRLSVNCSVREVYGDEAMLVNLFRNLLENAIRAESSCQKDAAAERAAGVVEWEGHKEDGQAVFSVTDHGIGMEEEELARITEPFYRVDKARSRADGGAGLGLALSEQIVRFHGGTLSFSSKKGEGTKAVVILQLPYNSDISL